LPEILYYFEDFTQGRRFETSRSVVTAEEIIEFASEFDPQPMHLDAQAGKASILGGLAASGWHTSAMMMRMMFDSFLGKTASEGAPGIDTMAWKNPVMAGDSLHYCGEVLNGRLLKSKPGIGLINFSHTLRNQNGDIVLYAENPAMVRLRPNAEL
jgi:acyl dehydratase